jgi:hypothetical protein
VKTEARAQRGTARGSFIERVWRAAWQPFDRRPIYESLAQDLVLGSESPYPGPFDIRNSGWIKEPLDALAQDHVRRVAVSGAAQLAKTLLGLIFVIWCVLRRPGLTTWNGQTDDAIKKVAEDKAWPLFRRCKSLKPLMPADRNKQRIRSIVFPHMSLRFQSASENNAHSDTVKNQVNDERHLWTPGLIHKFLSRVGSMPNHKILDLSTGSTKHADEKLADGTIREVGDDFFNDWNAGTREIWSVCCPGCGRLQPLAWKHRDHEGQEILDGNGKPVFGIVWDENETTRPSGRWAFAQVRKTARWRCQADTLGIKRYRHVKRGGAEIRQEIKDPCRFELTDSPDNIRQLNDIDRGARYQVTNPLADSIHRTFRFPAMVSELVGWGTLVVEWLKALDAAKAGDFGPLKTFVQNRLAEAWDESVTLTAESLATGDYELGADWLDDAGVPKCERRFITVDVQEKGGRHYWALCRDWSAIGESRLRYFDKLFAWEEIRAKQLELGIPDKRVIVDSADGNNTREIYEVCCRYGWTAFQGVDRESFPHPNPRQPSKPIMKLWSRSVKGDPSLGARVKAKGTRAGRRAVKLYAGARRFATLYRWSNPSIKDILARLLSNSWKYWGRPSNEPREYTNQVNSEIKKQERDKRGRMRWIWKQTRDDNHARDLEAMQVVAAMMSGLLVAEADAKAEPDGDKTAAEKLIAAAGKIVEAVKAKAAGTGERKVREYKLDPELRRYQRRSGPRVG